MRPARVRLRAAALMAVAALVLHELRYLLGYGSEARQALDQHGHGYVPLVALLAGLLLALAVAQLVAHVAGTRRDAPGASPHRSVALTWVAAATGLLAIYAGQELLEGLLSAGHPDGVSAVIAHGGGWALPLALLLGGVVALALGGARSVEELASRRARVLVPRSPTTAAVLPGAAYVASASVLGRHLAGRAPPLAG